MQQVQLSKISIGTGAEYAFSPKKYDCNTSWNNVIKKQFKDLANAMKVFATHSRNMDNHSWAKAGPPDGPEFYKIGHQIILDIKKKKNISFYIINDFIKEMETSVNVLLKNLPSKILDECELQLFQFKRIINADKIAVKSLQDLKIDPDLLILREEIEFYESEAKISEKSAVKFIDEVLEFFDKN